MKTDISTDEIVVIDLFCGAGGTTLGFEIAKWNGKRIAEVLACVNHSNLAIRDHSANFPKCKHFVEDVRLLDVHKLPRKEPGDKRIWILWASLECTHFSNAKTGPRNEDSRTLAYALFPYIDWINPDLIQIENVREFMSWGELDDLGRPKDRKKGIEYIRWRQLVESKGYRYGSRLLNSADYGAHQSRLRYFGVFAKNGLPIVFPAPTHDKHGRHGLPKWKAVREVLELEDVGADIFNRKKPLSPNTLKRVLAGLVKFVASGESSYLVKNYGGDPASKVQSLEKPGPTLTTIPHEMLVSPLFMVRSNGGNPEDRISDINTPAKTLTTCPNQQVVAARFLCQYNGRPEFSISHESVPCNTLTTRDRFGLATCRFIDNQFGTGRASSIEYPANTLTAVPKKNLVSAFLMPTNFFNEPVSLEQPSPVITANRKWHYLVNPQYGNAGASVDHPCFTLIARMGKRPPCLVTAEPAEKYGPIRYLDNAFFKDETVDVESRIRIFMSVYGISRIHMRMLKIVELKRIQGLGDEYILTGTQEHQKKHIGNAVVPAVVKAWAEAYYAELFGFAQNPQLQMF